MQASPEQQSLILELQLLDNEIMQANTKLKSLPEVEQLLHIDKRIIAATDEIATVKLEADQISLELRRGEVDVETVTDRIKKDEERLASGNATPKELEQTQHEIQTLRTWFKRKGAPGKTGGWVDCNSPIRKDGEIVGYKPCGRQKGEERSKYPSCRPTPSGCKDKGKGKTWGKTK